MLNNSNRHIFSYGLGLLGLLFIGVMAAGIVSLVKVDQASAAVSGCAQITTFPGSPYTNSQLECMLRNGRSTAYVWDQCRDDAFRPNAAIFGGNIRQMINGYSATYQSPYGGCAYSSSTWISERGYPNTTVPINVVYNTASVPLQINYVKYIDGPLVRVDHNGSGGWSNIYNDTGRWARPGVTIDRAPNAIGTGGQKPAHVGSRTKIVSLRAYRLVGGNRVYTGLSLSGGPGAHMDGQRTDNPNSRFWFARNPIDTTLNVSGGIRSNERIYVEMVYKRADFVYKGGGGSFEYLTLCSTGADRHELYSSSSPRYGSVIDLCERRTSTLRIDFETTQPYSLTPSVTTNPSAEVRQGESISAAPRVTNAGPGGSDGSHYWRVWRAIYDPGVTPQSGSNTNNAPCTWFQNEASCGHVTGGNNSFPVGVTDLPQDSYTVPLGTPVGSKVCFVMLVQRPDENSTTSEWRYSAMRCVDVVPPPEVATVQIWGYDTRIGGSAMAAHRGYVSGGSTREQGSWNEYGIFTGAQNIGVASAAGLNQGNASASQSNWSDLTFANVDAPSPCTGYGCYGGLPSAVALIDALKARCSSYSPGNRTVNAISNYSGVQYICAHGTVTITGDITLNNAPVSNVNSLPQIIIIGRDIVIDSSVERIDAWLIASPESGVGGRISTCSQATSPSGQFVNFNSGALTELEASTCPNQLTINGPTIASKLYLYRTNPSGSSGDYAERFNLRADSFLWAYTGGGVSAPVAETISIREAPPRF